MSPALGRVRVYWEQRGDIWVVVFDTGDEQQTLATMTGANLPKGTWAWIVSTTRLSSQGIESGMDLDEAMAEIERMLADAGLVASIERPAP
jgi:hypothetical protein